MTFADLCLSEEIIRAVTEKGYIEPTKIQAEAIPVILEGSDLLASSQTGSGKTASFVLPILHKLSDKSIKGPSSGRPKIRALVLVPTRELAIQVRENITAYSTHLKLASYDIIGGVGIKSQIKRFQSRVDILVATPGRLLDHIEQKTVDLSGVEILVLDEADRMLDMGFFLNMKKIMAYLPQKRQNLMFSATFSPEIKKLAEGLLHKPKLVEATTSNATAPLITHLVYPVEITKKRDLLRHLILDKKWHQVLIFSRTKHGADKIAYFLSKSGIPSEAIHSNKQQGARVRILEEFKSQKLQALVATDIASRGIDINELDYVINFDLPNVPEDYVHRIGRTGRAGREGFAVSLVAKEELRLLLDIEHKIGQQIKEEIITGFAPHDHADFRTIVRTKDSKPTQKKKHNFGKHPVQSEVKKSANDHQNKKQNNVSTKNKDSSNQSVSKKPYTAKKPDTLNRTYVKKNNKND